MKRDYVDIPEGQIHYLTDGEGEPLLLLHGTPLSSNLYSRAVPLLAERFRVIAMDTLGYGNSDKPPQGYTIEDYARSIVHFLDALGIDKTSIVGNFTGAFLAIEVAATNPDRVSKMVLDGLVLLTPEERKGFDERFKPTVISEDGSFLVQQWDRYRKAAPDLSLEALNMLVVDSFRAGPRLHDGHHAAFRYNLESKMGLIKIPTLLFTGDKDMFYDKFEVTKAVLPVCSSRVLKGQQFLMAYEEPDQFARMVLDFLTEPGS